MLYKLMNLGLNLLMKIGKDNDLISKLSNWILQDLTALFYILLFCLSHKTDVKFMINETSVEIMKHMFNVIFEVIVVMEMWNKPFFK